VPVLAVILFITDDLLIRVITIILIVIYVAFIIFLRDSVRFQGGYSISEDEDLESLSASPSEYEESFKIVSKTKDVEVITDETYTPDFSHTKTTLKPPDLKEKFEEIAYESQLLKKLIMLIRQYSSGIIRKKKSLQLKNMFQFQRI
jgi:hypothetical protein